MQANISKGLSILLLVLMGQMMHTSAQAAECVTLDNDTLKLSVWDTGNLGRSGSGTQTYLNLGGTEGVISEGWGIAADNELGNPVCAGFAGGISNQVLNLIVTSFTYNQPEATSVVKVRADSEDSLEVTHTFAPLPSLPNVYKVDVTVKNLLSDVGLKIRYRRTVEWFIDCGPYTGVETLQRGLSSKLILTDNSYGNPANPNLLFRVSLLNTDFSDVTVFCPAGLFDLDLGVLPPQGSISFSLYYGGFPDVASLSSALNTIGVEAYCSYGITLESPQFLQAWTGIGGNTTGIKTFTPSEFGNGQLNDPVFIQVSGRGFDPAATLKLHNEDTDEWIESQPDLTEVTADGFHISASFNLQGATIGNWKVVVVNPGDVTFVSPTTFQVFEQDKPIVKVDIIGQAMMGAGRSATFTLACLNSGELTAEGVVVSLSGIPDSVTLSDVGSSYLDEEYLEEGVTFHKVTFNDPQTIQPGDDNRQYLYIGLTAPSEVHNFTLEAKPETSTTPAVFSSPGIKDVAIVQSIDPNDKVGVSGVGEGRFIKGNEVLDYEILFENKAEATAPAQEVFVTDHLDTASFDLDSFSLGPIAFAQVKVIPPSGLKSFTTDVPFDIDGNPDTTEDNILVRINAHLVSDSADPNYGMFTCSLRTIDPATEDLPNNPLIGFLKPNITPPEGDGSVIFSVRAKSSLQNNHVIANGASIVFDLNPEILTPVWANTIDKVKPSSYVNVLPAVHYSSTFDLSWTGLDPNGSGIQSYNVYVSENDGPFTVLLNNTTLISTPFTGEAGKNYKFYSVATDQVGNTEDAPLRADVETSIQDPEIINVSAVWGPIDPCPVGTITTMGARFTHGGGSHSAVWNWGDGFTTAGTVSEVSGLGGYVSGTHTYTAAGVYTVNLTVSDQTGLEAQSIFRYVVIYDPNSGFVTGGGWINSPAGAYVPNPLLTGKATFGFNSKYNRGASVPTGQTQFTFHAAGMDFHSDNYEWLVVSGAKARYKGSGTMNCSGDYGFILIATDGQVKGGGGTDKFRIKIWDKTKNHQVVYDNELGALEDADPTTALQGGSIVIHKDK